MGTIEKAIRSSNLGLNPTNDGHFRLVASPGVHGEIIIAPSRERPMVVMRPGGTHIPEIGLALQSESLDEAVRELHDLLPTDAETDTTDPGIGASSPPRASSAAVSSSSSRPGSSARRSSRR